MRQYTPKRIAIVIFSGLLPCFLVLPGPCGIAEEGASERKLDRLIDQLGSGRFEIREAASRLPDGDGGSDTGAVQGAEVR